MVKKRPRDANGELRSNGYRQGLKRDPRYWRRRLFRNTFTYRGTRREVSHWCVKIQHLGLRKTFSLRSGAIDRAAEEALKIYKMIISRGWAGVRVPYEPVTFSGQQPQRAAAEILKEDPCKPSYWTERLVHRKYTEQLHAHAAHELSARVEHEGISYYLPLGTGHRKEAAARAARIFRIAATQGWCAVNEQFPREVSVAFHWADNPVAWTYATFHTRLVRPPAQSSGTRSDSRVQLAVVESDAGVRSALACSLNEQEGFRCQLAFSQAADALREIPRQRCHFVLVNQTLPNKAGAVLIEQLKTLAPQVSAVIFSVHEDSDQLFKSAPGGASGYLFRRASPTEILEPILDSVDGGRLTREKIAGSVRRYFEQAAASLPFGSSSSQFGNLTQREHEILGLLSKGRPDKEIADLLGISTWTVHGHLKKIFEKLGAHNRTDAVVKYLHK